MQPERRRWRWAILLGAAALLSVPVYLFLNQPAVLPQLQAVYQGAVRLYRATPPAALWLGMIAVMYVVAAVSLLEPAAKWWLQRRGPRTSGGQAPQAGGRVAALTRWLGQRSRGPLSRHFVRSAISELAVEMLAYRHRAPAQRIKTAVADQGFDLPPEVRAYLAAGLELWPSERWRWWHALAARLGLGRLVEPPETETDMERMLKYLEEWWEVPR